MRVNTSLLADHFAEPSLFLRPSPHTRFGSPILIPLSRKMHIILASVRKQTNHKHCYDESKGKF